VAAVRSGVVAAGFRVAEVRPRVVQVQDDSHEEPERSPVEVNLARETYSPDDHFAGRARSRYLYAGSQVATKLPDEMPSRAGSRLRD
jgi:hypothetical protein